MAKIQDIPMELLVDFCEALERVHSPSLAAFSLTSKQCRRAAVVVQHRQICVDGENVQHLTAAVARWVAILDDADSMVHVRRLSIAMWDPPIWDNVRGEAYQVAWAALARLVERLPYLTDLEYDVVLSFSPALLDVLDARGRPACRLHLRQFCLGSLIGPAWETDNVRGDFELQAEDLRRATSPHLYSLRLTLDSPYGRNHTDFNVEAIQQIVQGVNPSLKEVEIYRNLQRGARPIQRRPSGQALRVWHGFATRVRHRAELVSLRLAEYQGVTLERFEQWFKCVNFASLRTLRLCRGVDVEVLRWMVNKSSNRKSILPLLACLELEPGNGESAQDVASATQDFLRCLAPLEDLTLSGGFGELSDHMPSATLAAVLEVHGSTLLRLSLLPQEHFSRPTIYTSSDAFDLIAGCPQLDYLDVSIARLRGNREEVAVYRQLGSHLRLQSIHLYLDCTVDLLNTRLEDGLDKMPWNGHEYLCNGHIRNSMINCAFDVQLATAIFQHVATAKPLGATTLKQMEIQTTNCGIFRSNTIPELDGRDAPLVPLTLYPIMERLGGRKWRVTPNPRDDRLGEVVAERVFIDRDTWDPYDRSVALEETESMFRTLWPARMTGDFKDDWHSFPLAG